MMYVELVERHKDFFRMPWGFECGPGWYKIIEKLCADICAIIERDKLQDVYVTQIKEKYGTLRFYLNTETNEMSELVGKAAAESSITCEECGQPGKIIGNKWLMVRCENCKE